MTQNKQRLGIIQSRGLGDIIIALPIAHYYYKQGHTVYWPILNQWTEIFQEHAPWVKWIPIPQDTGAYFYDIPMKRLRNLGCTEIICLYQALSTHPEFKQEPWFQHTGFDQYKYIRAGVPFLNKWQLSECLTRNPQQEQELYTKLVTNPNYCIIHLQGSDHTANFDRSIIPEDWQTIEIQNQTKNPFDWLLLLEKAQSLILVDSFYANLVDQLKIGDDLYFLPRSHIQLTPTHGQHWTWLTNTNLPKYTQIFG